MEGGDHPLSHYLDQERKKLAEVTVLEQEVQEVAETLHKNLRFVMLLPMSELPDAAIGYENYRAWAQKKKIEMSSEMAALHTSFLFSGMRVYEVYETIVKVAGILVSLDNIEKMAYSLFNIAHERNKA